MIRLSQNEHRCVCGKLLFKGIIISGIMEIKCKNCGTMNRMGKMKIDESGQGYLLIINDKGLILDMSESACSVLGYTYEELVKKHYKIISSDVPNDACCKLLDSKECLSEDNHFQINSLHKTKDNIDIPVIVFFKIYTADNAEKVISLSVKFKNKIEYIDKIDKDKTNNDCDFDFELDRNGVLTYINPSFIRLFKLKEELSLGINLSNDFPNIINEEHRKLFDSHVISELPYRVLNNKFVFDNGDVILYDLYFTPNFNDFGNFLGYRALGWLIIKV